jgi:hypothetical protein
MGTHGNGRKQKRDWDAVNQWVIYIHADGTPSNLALKDSQLQPSPN